jgi:hypothetical protein
MASENRPEPSAAKTALFTLVGCGALGLLLIVADIALVGDWGQALIDWLRQRTPVGDKPPQPWKAAAGVGTILIGLLLMLVGVIPARRFERTDPLIRRVIYGYNAFLNGFLLLIVLIVINLFVFNMLPRYLDATEGGFHSISETTKNFVRDIDRSTKVYVMLPESDIQGQIKTMLSNCREMNPKYFEVIELSLSLSDSRIRELKKKYPAMNLDDEGGLLITFGDDPNKFSFIRSSELYNVNFDRRRGEASSRQFTGEVKLLQEMMFLAENKEKQVVYFLQGNGEPKLDDRGARGLARVTDRMVKNNFEVKPLILDGTDPKVPNDASLVVVIVSYESAKPLLDSALKAIRNFLDTPGKDGKSKGKLLVFMDPLPAAKPGEMKRTGIEDVLRDYNVDVTGERILTFAVPRSLVVSGGGPTTTIATPPESATSGGNPVALAFSNKLLVLPETRNLRPFTKNPAFRAEPLLATIGAVWADSDPDIAPEQRARQFESDPQLGRQMITKNLTVALTVTETPMPNPAGEPSGKNTPRMAVFGDADMIVNAVAGREDLEHFDLILSTINWLRERDTNVGVQPKTHRTFSIPQAVSYTNLVYIPVSLLLVVIVIMGVGVWVSRRR